MEILAMKPPHIRKFIARGMNIPPQWLSELEAAEAAFMQKQAMLNPQGGTQNRNQPGQANGSAGQMQQLAGVGT